MIELYYRETQAFVSLDGAYVTSFKIQNKDIIYPDGILKINNKEKRRGGIPLLFPWADELKGTDLPRHGFVRDLKWEEISTSNELIPDKTLLRLEANKKTKKMFPYNFETNLEVSLGENSLSYKLTVFNKDKKDMPIAPGFHPYFKIPEGNLADIKTNIAGFNNEKYELGKTLLFPLQDLEVFIPEAGSLKVKYGGSFKRPQSKLAVWTDKKGDEEDDGYICFEPWATDLGGFLKKDQQLLIPPGEEALFTMRLTLS